METEVARGLPGYDAVGGDDGDVERVVVGGVCLFVLTDVLNGGVEVCRPAPTLVFSGEFESVGIDETSVGMFDELRDDEVLGVVVECVDLKVESGNPLCGSEGELPGIECLRGEFGGILRIAQHGCEEEVDFAIEVWCVDEGLGIGELDVPLGLEIDECETW